MLLDICLQFVRPCLPVVSRVADAAGKTDKLLQAADPRVRGAGPPGLFQPEPFGWHPDSHVLTEPKSQADRGALS